MYQLHKNLAIIICLTSSTCNTDNNITVLFLCFALSLQIRHMSKCTRRVSCFFVQIHLISLVQVLVFRCYLLLCQSPFSSNHVSLRLNKFPVELYAVYFYSNHNYSRSELGAMQQGLTGHLTLTNYFQIKLGTCNTDNYFLQGAPKKLHTLIIYSKTYCSN